MNWLRRLRFWAHLILAGRAAHDAHVAYLYREMEDARKRMQEYDSCYLEVYSLQYAKAHAAYHKFCGH